MITTVQTASIWNVGIKTAAAQNMVAIGFIEKAFSKTITWLEWFIAAAPFGVLMSIALYFVMTRMMPPEVKEVPGGREAIRKSLAELGPMKASEKKLLAISLTLLGFWATEGVLHRFDTSTTTIAAVALMFLPGIGIMTWKEAQPRIPVGHDRAVRHRHQPRHRAAADQGRRPGSPTSWSPQFGLKNATALFILGVMSLFLIVIHLGFASATALASAMIPIVIAVLQERGDARHQHRRHDHAAAVRGQLRLHPGGERAAEHGGLRHRDLQARDFVRTGLVLTVIALALVMLLGATYWRWLGYV